MIYLNYRGLDIVGKSAEVITILVLAPFVLLLLLAIPHMHPENWLDSKPLKEVNWIDYFNIMFWNLNSWDSVSTLAGEVRDPARMVPKALFFSVQIVCSSSNSLLLAARPQGTLSTCSTFFLELGRDL
jgi:amino acid transporter